MNSLKITRDANFDNININGSYNVPIINSLIELENMNTIGNIVFVNSENNFYFHLKNGWSPLGDGDEEDDIEILLTTKGDLLGRSTEIIRIPVGTDNQVLTAETNEALGVRWAGKLNVAQATSTAPQIFSGNIWTSCTGLSLTITPRERPVKLFARIGNTIDRTETFFSIFREDINLGITNYGFARSFTGFYGKDNTIVMIYADYPPAGIEVTYYVKYNNIDEYIYSRTNHSTSMTNTFMAEY